MNYTRTEIRTFMFFVVSAIACPFLLWSGISGLRKAAATKKWPTVEGTMRGVEVQVVKTKGRYFTSSTKYHPNLTYVYRVGGEEYFGAQVSTAQTDFADETEARQWLGRYHADMAVTVYYDPENPKNAVLETGVKGAHWTKVWIGLAAGALAWFLGRGYYRALNATTLKSRDGGLF